MTLRVRIFKCLSQNKSVHPVRQTPLLVASQSYAVLIIDILQLADWVLDGHLLTPLQIHYFDFQSRGRGQVIRLLFEDAGIAYTDVRYSFGEFIEGKDTHPMLSRNPTKSVPIIELGSRLLTQSYPILRHVARLLGEYDGKTEEERFHADLICDIAADCKSSPTIHG